MSPVNLTSDTGSSSTDRVTSNVALSLSFDPGADALADVRTFYKVTLANGTLVRDWAASYVQPTLDADYTVSVKVVDKAGNERTDALDFTRLTVSPITPTLSLKTDSGRSLLFMADRITNDGLVKYTQTYASGVTLTYQFSTNGGSTWSTPTATFAPITDGAYQVRAIATDQSFFSSSLLNYAVINGVATGGAVVGSAINVSATINETVQAGSFIRVSLDTGAVVTLTAATNGRLLEGTYTVGANQSTADLTINNILSARLTDLAGNQMGGDFSGINLQGGAGTDELQLVGSGQTFELTVADIVTGGRVLGALTSIEVIDIGSGLNQLKLGTDMANVEVITGQSGAAAFLRIDGVNGKVFLPDGWDILDVNADLAADTVQIEGSSYLLYTNRGSTGGNDTVAVQNGVSAVYLSQLQAASGVTVSLGISLGATGTALGVGTAVLGGNGSVWGAEGTDILTGIENVYGGFGADLLVGDTVANFLQGGAGRDTLSAVGANDTLWGGAGDDSLVGGSGADAFVLELGNDTYLGGETVSGGPADTLDLRALSGDVTALATSANNVTSVTVNGGQTYGTDEVRYMDVWLFGNGNVTFQNGLGSGSTVTGTWAETITTGTGNDSIWSGGGNDMINSGAGNDTISPGAGATSDDSDTVDGGAGVDWLFYQSVNSVWVSLDGGSASYQQVSLSGATTGMDYVRGFEHIWLGSAADRVNGSAASESIIGGNGADTVWGGGGNDFINVAGTDVGAVDYVYAGMGNDTIFTGGGAKEFVSVTGGDNYIDMGDFAVNSYTDYQSDTVYAGAGNDTIVNFMGGPYYGTWNSTTITYIDAGNGNNWIQAGAGMDMVKFDGAGLVLDLTLSMHATGNWLNVERIDLTGTGNNTLKLAAADIVDLSDLTVGDASSSNFTLRPFLMMDGNAGDAIDMSALGSGMTLARIVSGTLSYDFNGNTVIDAVETAAIQSPGRVTFTTALTGLQTYNVYNVACS
eukprot:gene1801-1769_t